MKLFTRKALIIAGVGLLAFVLVAVASMEYTSRSEFCNTCHYMEPFYRAWETSTHSDVECVTCHYPPGIASKLEGKVKGLEQLFKYATQSYRRSKPWAEIPDESCLRSGCHEKRLLKGRVEFKKEISFDHTPHITQLRRGKKLRCTSCHSQIVQGEHMTVTSSTCFLCHFKGLDSEARPSCTNCHEPPVMRPGHMVSYDHTLVKERGIECNRCHGQMVVGDGAVPKENCEDCHFQRERLERYGDLDFIHNKHITEHKIECQRCHLPIQHKSVSRTAAVKPDCQGCHPDFHQSQQMLFTGTGGKGDLKNHPSAMFEGGLNCQACHILHSDFEGFAPSGETYKAGKEACESCHGPGYANLIEAWEDSTDKRLVVIEKARERVEKRVGAVDTLAGNGMEIFKQLNDAQYNFNLVRLGKSVHNINYSNELLFASWKSLNNALSLAGAKTDLGQYPWSNRTVPSECENCHSGIEKVKVDIYGLEFEHDRHLGNDGVSCRTCHSNMRKHGEMIKTRDECMECHHSEQNIAEENCSPCHEGQRLLYSGKSFGMDMPDMMFDAGVGCPACHMADADTVSRPTDQVCLNCHDEGYEELFTSWQTTTSEQITQLEALLVEIDADKLTGGQHKIVDKARNTLRLFSKDGSLGVHNSMLTEAALSGVISGLEELKPGD